MKKLITVFVIILSGQTIGAVQQDDRHQEVKIEKLTETSDSWDGTALPGYPGGKPVITILRYTFPPRMRLSEHYHSIINCGVVLNGELTIVTKEGREKTFHAGDAIVEMIGGVHYGENRGDTPAEVIMFYAGETGSPLSVKP